MKQSSATTGLISFYLILSLSVPAVLSLWLLSNARMTAIKGDEPNYLSHQLPAEDSASVNSQLHYKLEDIHKGKLVIPRSFLSTLPKSLKNEPNVRVKKDLFVKTMLPLILRANELIVEDRMKLIAMDKKLHKGGKLSKREIRWITPLFKKYRVKYKPTKDITHLHIESLFIKMDIIPPSLALAQAAIESGWGTSYFSQNYQALFGQWTWNAKDKGVVPANRPDGMTHRIRAFDFLLDSVISYMTNLNRHNAYQGLRDRRIELKKHSLPITGPGLAPALEKYSEKGERYVTDLLNIISYNKFTKYDLARLENSDIKMASIE
ncbi:glucosaminidase domain-containing protein [Temperatibacter marinus]|uniref:Glucosaminidase domain-containing protein n=1 Tax=Temperatibacter marinus TaxID=1456591 RepID=A0AA52ED94_9PROT|nr:glucosaminidase domain-containing protein [Temperatibacter marinus]WND02565.1 glucosaminidase domain-containing protein [Temperatibacter marinus]